MIVKRLIPIIALVLCENFDPGAGADPVTLDTNDADFLIECPWVWECQENYDTKLTENLRVPDLNAVCNDRCEITALDCIIGCENDVNCISGCLRDQTECSNGKSKLKREPRTAPAASGCVTHRVYRLYSTASVFYGVFNFRWLLITLYILGCPCGIGCSDGCDDCSNPVCQCEVSLSMNHTAWSVDLWQIVIIITWFYRIWRRIETGTSVLTIMVRPWADASTPAMAMKVAKPIASMVSREDKPTARAR